MDRQAVTKKRIEEHCAKYPGLHVQDIFKFLHQSSFGCEHMVTDEARVVRYIKEEAANYTREALLKMPLSEPLDGPYVRAHLRWLTEGLSPETLGRLFVLSSDRVENGRALLEEKLAVFLTMNAGTPGFGELTEGINLWRKMDFQALHHSEDFRALYRPAYRVIREEYARLLPLFSAIDRGLQEGKHPEEIPEVKALRNGETGETCYLCVYGERNSAEKP